MQKYFNITDMLQDSDSPHLADCLDMVPAEKLNAVLAMIETEMGNGERRSVVRKKVVHDMTELVAGTYEPQLYSIKYMHAAEALICGKCGNNNNILHKVSIPNCDINQVCPDCFKTLEMYANTVGVL